MSPWTMNWKQFTKGVFVISLTKNNYTDKESNLEI